MKLMKKAFLFFIFTVSTLAAQQAALPTPAQQTAKKQEGVAAAVLPKTGQSEIMIIQPEMRAKDIDQAFKYLKQMNAAGKIGVKLKNGSTIYDILNMNVMAGGTIIIFQISSTQGQKLRAVNVEDVDTLTNEF